MNIFNAALVTPTYYVFFTSTTIITSAVLFRGFHGTGVQIATVVMGFLVICSGVVLLQLSKSAKDVPDAAIFKGDLDQVREVAEQAAEESEPRADAIRGTASIIRRMSTARRATEHMEAKRFRDEKLAEALEPLKENEVAEWDGLRRRKTIIGAGPISSPIARRKTIHPPLGMSYIPEENSPETEEDGTNKAFLEGVRDRAQTMFVTRNKKQDSLAVEVGDPQSPIHPVALTDIRFPKGSDASSPALPYGPGSFEEAQEHIYGHPVLPSPRSKPLPASPMPSDGGLAPPSSAKRQFSFSNFLKHPRKSSHSTDSHPVRPSTAASHTERKAAKNATEEERLGLVKGDSSRPLMGDSSPERARVTSQQETVPESPLEPVTSLYDNYPYTHTQSQRHHRSASPDAISDRDAGSDDERLRARDARSHQPFSFSSAGPSPGTTTPQRPSSRRRPTPPQVYTPPVRPSQPRDFAQSAERVPQYPSLQPPSQTSLKRVTIGNEAPLASRSAPSLEPSVHFGPSDQQRRQEGSPTSRRQNLDIASRSDQNLPDAGESSRRGRPSGAIMQEVHTQHLDSQSPNRSDNSKNGSKERYAEQSARERAERRERTQRRQSQGPDSERQSMDFS